jgi:hypothetical protein
MSIVKILFYAFVNTKNIFRSIIGDNLNSNLNENDNSELNKKYWSFFKLLEFGSDLFLPKLPIKSPSWIPKFFKKTLFGSNSRYLPDTTEEIDNICVLYLNGIISNRDIIELNRKQISSILNRPVNIIYNVTDSFIIDIFECLIGKETEYLTEASTITLYILSRKLLDPNIKKILLICHSQGTIITAKALQYLSKFGLNKEIYMKKLEIYSFANCASKMNYVYDKYPYMEHFANGEDFVARLGCNCCENVKKYISIDGEIIINNNKSGHMFNSHYINDFINEYPQSRLMSYIRNENFE